MEEKVDSGVEFRVSDARFRVEVCGVRRRTGERRRWLFKCMIQDFGFRDSVPGLRVEGQDR